MTEKICPICNEVEDNNCQEWNKIKSEARKSGYYKKCNSRGNWL